MMVSVKWMRDMAERAVSTFMQGFLSVCGGDVLGLWALNWRVAFGIGVGAGLLSVVKSMIASKRGDPDSASLVD